MTALPIANCTARVNVRQPFQADWFTSLQREWVQWVSLERLTYVRCAVVIGGGTRPRTIQQLCGFSLKHDEKSSLTVRGRVPPPVS